MHVGILESVDGQPLDLLVGAFTASPVPKVVVALGEGEAGRFVAANQAFGDLLGYHRQELIGRGAYLVVAPEGRDSVGDLVSGMIAGRIRQAAAEQVLVCRDGSRVRAAGRVFLAHDRSGAPFLIAEIVDSGSRQVLHRPDPGPGGRPTQVQVLEIRSEVTAACAAELALAERNTELEAANQLKLDIIGMLGHEIGNPLTTIKGQAEILADDWMNLDDGRRNRAIEAIGRQAARLDDIVREVLTMVTIDAGSIRADRRVLAVRAEIDGALSALPALEPPSVLGDDARVLFAPGHLQQILINLLSNAAKYGGGATAVRIEHADGWVHVTVEDHGPGVPEQFRDRLFDRLTRADRDAAAVEGTGLGLYIVRGLARANQGDVHHEPNPAGGSRFVLDLQAAP